ncbi:hypothetical protein FH972_025894 [Carpinus fangiana]|uniref:JmjC domain-containing protein n=1 Tax=Carpinus fangiana TaxID=176857 RepID=A0A5N6L2C3_9ROSI|nr:hypothetical protein FH972_025894 [Carpinus fangiana]
MAPSVAVLPQVSGTSLDGGEVYPCPSKRRKLSADDSERLLKHGHAVTDGEEESEASASRVPKHPLGVRPLGNLYDATEPNIRTKCGTMALLPDELIIQILELLDARDLVHLGSACRAFYALTRSDDLWKALFIECPPRSFAWRGSWRATHLSMPLSPRPIKCLGLYSDALYRPFQCAHTPLRPFTESIPAANRIPRLHDLSARSFTEDGWAERPFILTDPVKSWRAYKEWSTSHLLSRYGKTAFRAEAVDWPLATYVNYMHDCTDDESPLYLFDCAFVEKMGLRVPEDGVSAAQSQLEDEYDYIPPTTFHPDLFSPLAAQRPHHRWIILGPARSGSTFHKDPNATSAWNAVLRGSKYWIMFPSGADIPSPPGVYVSADQSEVTSPLSIAEWLLSFHAEARRTKGCMEGICGEGEVLYVPSGWYHLVLNLEESLAITQNFVPRAHLANALEFMRDRPEQVTGFKKDVKDPYGLFVERLRETHGCEMVEQGLREVEQKTRSKKEKGKWETLVEGHGEDGDGGGFSFGFGLDGRNSDDDDDDAVDAVVDRVE